jgi:hypothetical protein
MNGSLLLLLLQLAGTPTPTQSECEEIRSILSKQGNVRMRTDDGDCDCRFVVSGKRDEVVYHYVDRYDMYTKIERPESSVRYAFDERGRMAGATYAVGGFTFEGKYDDDSLTVAGLPRIDVARNREGRVTVVRADGRNVVEYRYEASRLFPESDSLSTATLDGLLTLKLAPTSDHEVAQTLNRRGRVIATRVVNQWKSLNEPIVYPILFEEHPMKSRGCSGVRKANEFPLGRLYDNEGKLWMYIIELDRHKAAFDAETGVPLLVDFRADLYDSVTGLVPGTDIMIDGGVEVEGVAPDRVVVTTAGVTSMYAQRPADASIYQIVNRGGKEFSWAFAPSNCD